MTILIENICKTFRKNLVVLDKIYLEIKAGSFVALVGPSGSGKSTLLKIIAGIEKPDKGCIWYDEKKGPFISLQKRQIGYVFQDYALFPKMTVYENIEFAIKSKEKTHDYKRVKTFLQAVQLEESAYKLPDQLSGGEKQRVALARAFASNPFYLLLDEPFGALDGKMKENVKEYLSNLKKLSHQNLTIILVTHDYTDVVTFADRLFLLHKGHIEKIIIPYKFKL